MSEKDAIIQNFALVPGSRMLLTHGAPRAAFPPVALTIGNFDGVHLGHQAMLARLISEARQRRLASCVLSFEPHPREFFSPRGAPTRLSSLREKFELLAAHGIERWHVQRFTRSFAALTPEAFVSEFLARGLKARWLLIGEDFRFGAKRAGDLALLRRLAARHGIEVAAMPTVTRAGQRVSSSAIRKALEAGDLATAEALLGRAYSISGRVVHGDKLGRQLGFATANVQLRHNRPPLTGIYAVRVHGAGEGARPGVASLGVRPTVTSSGEAVLEVHLFDFSGELYGRHLRVEFLHKIRDEEKYPDLETLRSQIARDCDAARSFLMESRNV
jgi:riboflavin kinase/FMN adenylyltransferase